MSTIIGEEKVLLGNKHHQLIHCKWRMVLLNLMQEKEKSFGNYEMSKDK
jgi:hypothetical protein